LKMIIAIVCVALGAGLLHVDAFAGNSLNKTGYIVAISGLVLRDKPSKTGKKLLIVPFNTELKTIRELPGELVDGEVANWYEVEYANTKGFIFGAYVSFNKPLKVNPGNASLYNSIKECVIAGVCCNNKKIKLGMSLDQVLKLFGKPKEVSNGEWAGYFIYNDYDIGFDDYLFEDYNAPSKYDRFKNLKVSSFLIICEKMKFNFNEMIQVLGKPENYGYNMELQTWEVVYKYGKSYLVFHFRDLNTYANSYETFIGK
jgi:hypothetical protein